MNFTWTTEMHRGFGIMGFADGHAQIYRDTNLNSAFRVHDSAMRLSVP